MNLERLSRRARRVGWSSLIALGVALTTAQGVVCGRVSGWAAEAAAAPLVHTRLDADLAPLRAAFDQNRDTPRLLLILSPT